MDCSRCSASGPRVGRDRECISLAPPFLHVHLCVIYGWRAKFGASVWWARWPIEAKHNESHAACKCSDGAQSQTHKDLRCLQTRPGVLVAQHTANSSLALKKVVCATATPLLSFFTEKLKGAAAHDAKRCHWAGTCTASPATAQRELATMRPVRLRAAGELHRSSIVVPCSCTSLSLNFH